MTLTHGDEQPVSRERYHGYEVHCEDSHVMLVKADLEVVVSTGVHEGRSVHLSFFDSAVVVSTTALGILVCAIDERVIDRWLSNDSTRELVNIRDGCLIEPVLHR